MTTWLFQPTYLVMILQLIVSFTIAPLLSIYIINRVALKYGVRRYPHVGSEIASFLVIARRKFLRVLLPVAFVSAAIVIHAIIMESELLAWDNQSGIMLLYLLAIIPVLFMGFLHKQLFDIVKKHTGSIRSASLVRRTLKEYLSLPALCLVVMANAVFIATVIHFNEHPFEGFTGNANLAGLVFLNLVFGMGVYLIFKDRNISAITRPEHRDNIRKRAILINLVILSVTLLHVSLNMWMSDPELHQYKLFSQSLFLQLVLIVTVYTFTLPNAMFRYANEPANHKVHQGTDAF